MDKRDRRTLEAAREVLLIVCESQQDLLELAENGEKQELREVVYDLQQSATLVTRALNR